MALVPLNEARSKLLSLDEAKNKIDALRQTNPNIVIGTTCGAYTIPHRGHFESFRDAKLHCDVLVVIVCSKKSIEKLGRLHDLMRDDISRMETIAQRKNVDIVIANDDDSAERIIHTLKPDLFIKGAEAKYQSLSSPDQLTALRNGVRVIVTPIPNKTSASELLKKSKKVPNSNISI